MTEWITDHRRRAVADLLSQYRDRPTIEAVTRALAGPAQRLEDALQTFARALLLPYAMGPALGALAALVGERRDGLPDTQLRRWIEARILGNLGSGEPWRVVECLRLMTGADRVVYRPVYPAGASLYYEVPAALSSATRARVAARLLDILPSGVSLSLVEGVTGSLILSEDAGPGERLGVGVLATRIA
jgi:hypothetical protein